VTGGCGYGMIKTAVDKIRELTGDSTYNLPEDFMCWLLLGTIDCVDLYGSYSFYNHNIVLKALKLNEMLFLISNATIYSGLIPFAGVPRSNKMYFLAQKSQQNYSRGQIITSGSDGFYPIAENFEVFLTHYIIQLETGNYRLREGRISLFPKLNIPTAITKHVKITASPLFIPERSRPGDYLWAYSITISMDSTAPQGNDCQLMRRHWEITSVGRTEEVNGAGVIGEHPKMFPGAEFTYESCCPLVDNTGSMKGSFQMKRDIDGQLFDAIVPQFNFTVPPLIHMSDLLKKENQPPQKPH